MTKKPKHTEMFELSEHDALFMQNLSNAAMPAFVQSMSIFLRACGKAGYPKHIASASFCVWILSNLVRLTSIAADVPEHERNPEAISKLATDVQEFLAKRVSQHIEDRKARAAAPNN